MDDYRNENFENLRSGVWLNGFIDDFGDALKRCEDLCFKLNMTAPSEHSERESMIRQILGKIGNNFIIHSPFLCDFGFNIKIGENFKGNFNLTILDEAEVSIGDNVFIGPNTTLCTITHELDFEKRNAGIMQAKAIVIKDNVWIASNVVVLPGITIGEGAVIGAGSVVTKDVEPFTLVVGNPAKPIKSLLSD